MPKDRTNPAPSTADKKRRLTRRKKADSSGTKPNKKKIVKVVPFPKKGLTQKELIDEWFREEEFVRYEALFNELKNGKGIARLQAEARIAEIAQQRKDDDSNAPIELDWDVVATTEAKSIAAG